MIKHTCHVLIYINILRNGMHPSMNRMLFLTRYELHVTAVYYTTAEIKLKSVLICTMGHVRSVKGTGRSDAAKFFTLIACLRYKLSR